MKTAIKAKNRALPMRTRSMLSNIGFASLGAIALFPSQQYIGVLGYIGALIIYALVIGYIRFYVLGN